MADFIIIIILVILIGAAVTYIVKAKKSGAQCMGCPAAGKCAGKKGVHKHILFHHVLSYDVNTRKPFLP